MITKKSAVPKPKNKEEKFYPSKEQGIISSKRQEDKEIDEEDDDIYEKAGRKKLEEEDEIEPWEEGFMEGEVEGGQLAKDALTGKPLMDIDDVVEIEIGGKFYRFTNVENAKKFKEKMLKKN